MYQLDTNGEPDRFAGGPKGPKMCACLELQSLESIHADFGFIPEHFHTLTTSDIEIHEEDRPKLDTFLADPAGAWSGKGLYIWGGNVGCGKTTLAHLVVRRLYEYARAEWLFPNPEDYSAWYVLAPTFGSVAYSSRDSFRVELDFLGESRKIDLWTVPGPVVLDEFGREGSARERKTVRALYESFFRERIGKPTIVVSHSRPDEIPDTFGEQVASLMSSSMETIELTGLDKRASKNSSFFVKR